jgi:hypothetical protein
MFNLDFALEGVDEFFIIGELLLEIEKELLDKEPYMRSVVIEKGEYEFTLDFGYDGIEETIIRRLK